jgi:hypothetical protein
MAKRTITPEKRILATIGIIANLIRSIQMKRVLHGANAKPHLVFWQVLYGNLSDVATIEWCKLFGSDDEAHQPVHWKNSIRQSEHADFRKRLLAHLGISKREFDKYWKDVKRNRDKRVAHMDFDQPDGDAWPVFDIALESACFYYDELLKEWRRLGRRTYPDDIREYCQKFADQSARIAQTALRATSRIIERVDGSVSAHPSRRKSQ